MIRASAVLCTLFALLGGTVSPAVAARDLRTLPMQFDLRTEGPADSCGNKCRRWISAFGAITADTPRDFLNFASGKDLRGATIAFDSDGGSTLGALGLGREIRRLELTTTVGRAVDLPGDNTRASLDAKADCESMCAFVLLAGTRRHVPAEARVMVHQIWLGDRRDDPTAASYSAEDLVLVQRDIGRIAQYTVEMGASAELLDIALRIPPWEPMRQLTRDELKRLQFLTVDNAFEQTPAAPFATTRATNAAPAAGSGDRSRIGRRAWNLLDGANGTALTRRHPITVEGDEIGAFDITFACGASPDSYLLSYSEWRRGKETDRSPPALNAVTIYVGQKPMSLNVASSVRNEGDVGELDTFASAAVTADTIKSLAVYNNRSLVVATAGAGRDTSIRLGNTGLSQNFPLLAASCEKALLAKADPPRAKTGALAHAD